MKVKPRVKFGASVILFLIAAISAIKPAFAQRNEMENGFLTRSILYREVRTTQLWLGPDQWKMLQPFMLWFRPAYGSAPYISSICNKEIKAQKSSPTLIHASSSTAPLKCLNEDPIFQLVFMERSQLICAVDFLSQRMLPRKTFVLCRRFKYYSAIWRSSRVL